MMNSFMKILFKKVRPEILNWRRNYLRNKQDYTDTSLWQGVGKHPLDLLLLDLAHLYENARQDEKDFIGNIFTNRQHCLWQLVIFIRRMAILVASGKDYELLRYSVDIALIEDARFDFRDLIVSLLILRYAAERANIEIEEMFEDAMKTAKSQITKDVFTNVRNHSREDLMYTIKKSGPPKWVETN